MEHPLESHLAFHSFLLSTDTYVFGIILSAEDTAANPP